MGHNGFRKFGLFSQINGPSQVSLFLNIVKYLEKFYKTLGVEKSEIEKSQLFAPDGLHEAFHGPWRGPPAVEDSHGSTMEVGTDRLRTTRGFKDHGVNHEPWWSNVVLPPQESYDTWEVHDSGRPPRTVVVSKEEPLPNPTSPEFKSLTMTITTGHGELQGLWCPLPPTPSRWIFNLSHGCFGLFLCFH